MMPAPLLEERAYPRVGEGFRVPGVSNVRISFCGAEFLVTVTTLGQTG